MEHIDLFINRCENLIITSDMISIDSWILSHNDLVLNFSQWKKEKGKNILYVTGLSGSGKSTLAEQYESKYNAIMFEIDGIEHNYDSTRTKILQKVKDTHPKYKKAIESKWVDYNQIEMIAMIDSIYNSVKKIIDADYKNLYIIEGIQLFQFISINTVYKKPLIIKGTSALQSILQRMKRDNNGKIDWIRELKNSFPEFMGMYVRHEKLLKEFKSKMQSK